MTPGAAPASYLLTSPAHTHFRSAMAKIGILGPGRIGSTLGKLWALAGHDVMLGFSRHPQRLLETAVWANGRSGSPAEVAAFGDVLLLSPPWWVLPELRGVGEAFRGKIVIDATNPYSQGWGPRDPSLGPNEAAVSRLAGWWPAARLVKAFNTVPAATLAARLPPPDAENFQPAQVPAPAVLTFGDDAAALASAARLVEDAGFYPVAMGALAEAVWGELGGPLYGRHIDADLARQWLAQHGAHPAPH